MRASLPHSSHQDHATVRLGILSDLHLAPPPLNRCTTPPDRLQALLATLRDHCDHVVLAGDTFDMLRPRSWRNWPAQREAMASRWPGLVGEIESCQKVVGNHDLPLSTEGVPEALRFEAPWGDVLITHGHQSDPWVKKIWGLQEAANFLAGHLERRQLKPLSLAMGKVPLLWDILSPAPTHPVAASRIERYAQHQPAQVVVCGHTHGLELKPMNGGKRLFVNTGSHAHGHQDWVIVDLGAARVELWRSEVLVAKAARTSELWHVHHTP